MMPPSAFRLTELPIEILEQILLHLPGQDIIKTEAISRQFRDLAHSSPALQYRRELFAAGLVDNPRSPCNLEERRRLCRDYVHKWSDPTNIGDTLRELPLKYQLSSWNDSTILGRNIIAVCSQSNNIDFLHIPPAISRKPPERWSIHELPFRTSRYTAYPPKNILVIAEQEEGSIRIHLLNLMDGSPYRVPPSNIIAWALPPGVEGMSIEDLVMTGSRIMMYICLRDESQPGETWRMIIWDWNTGELVFDRSSADGSGLIGWNCQAAFLDEFRIFVVFLNNFPHTLELFVFNTLFPQNHPRHLRRLRLPSRHNQWNVRVHLDRDRSLGTVDRDGPLLVDPTQAILIMDLSPTNRVPHTFLILRMQDLIEHVCSIRTEVRIPWDEWGKGAVVIEVPFDTIYLSTIIHGARVLTIRNTHRGPEEHYRMHIFDFSWRASAALPLSDGSDGGTERRAVFNNGRNCLFGEGGGVIMWGLQSLGDSVLFYIYRETLPGHFERTLRVLDLM